MVLENADYLPSNLLVNLNKQHENGNRQLPRSSLKN